jgi:Spy/CpxP family protein refolding chaperone
MTVTIVLLLLAFLLSTPPLYAQQSYSEFERGLELSDSQKVRMEQIKRRYMGEIRSLQRESLSIRIELRELSRNPSENAERMMRLRRELDQIEVAKEGIYHQYRSEMIRSLNDKQRERFNNFCETENKKNMRRFRQRGYE